jgi:ATP-dependent Lon protease
MRRALMVAFGNARLEHRSALQCADLPRSAAGRSRIGFMN